MRADAWFNCAQDEDADVLQKPVQHNWAVQSTVVPVSKQQICDHHGGPGYVAARLEPESAEPPDGTACRRYLVFDDEDDRACALSQEHVGASQALRELFECAGASRHSPEVRSSVHAIPFLCRDCRSALCHGCTCAGTGRSTLCTNASND